MDNQAAAARVTESKLARIPEWRDAGRRLRSDTAASAVAPDQEQAMMQGGEGSVRGPASASRAGSTITVEVGDSVIQIEVGVLGSPFAVVYPATSRGELVAGQSPLANGRQRAQWCIGEFLQAVGDPLQQFADPFAIGAVPAEQRTSQFNGADSVSPMSARRRMVSTRGWIVSSTTSIADSVWSL